jgi:23S rRNA pseudouridine2605 synthase
MRLNRFLAAAGLGSRRSVEELIRTGRVKINGRVTTELATKVRSEDSVKVGSRVLKSEPALTALLYKPRGVVCTAKDERGREIIFDLLPKNWPRVFHVGRLDRESEGLMLVTNEGDLALALTHPRFKIEKEYEVRLDRPFDPAHRDKLLRGFSIPGGRGKVERVEIASPQLLRLTLLQGIKRQIRLMLYELGYEVENLCRIRIGNLRIGRMRPAEWRLLTARELSDLQVAKPPSP